MKSKPELKQFIPNILIVDDAPANLKILNDILDAEGYKVRPVLSGTMALQVAQVEKPDLILLDIMMPGMNGFELCRLLQENDNLSDVPIIFISALTDTNEIVRALTSGAADYITKPFNAEEVKARVATHVKLYRQKAELREQSIKLQKLNAEKDKFFSIIAHDLRSPFNGFLGLTELMAEGLNNLNMDELQRISRSLRTSANQLFRLLENLLDWSRMEQGLLPFNPEAVQLQKVVDECISGIQAPANKKRIEILRRIPDGLIVFADLNMLNTAIRNLVSNAVKFTPREGSIIISANPEVDNKVKISIKDTGIGMSRSLMDGLFQIEGKSTRKGTEQEPGTGLGLLLCKEFIEKHGGSLSIVSEVDQGSEFHFTLERVE